MTRARRSATAFFISLLVLAALIHCGATSSSDVSDGGSAGDGSYVQDASITDAGAADSEVEAAPCAAASRVQFAFGANDAGGDDSFTVTLPSATHAGDFIVVGVDYFDCAAITAVTDTAANTFKSLISASGNGQSGDLETWGATNITPAASESITVHFTTACNSRNLKVVEYAGIDSLAPVIETATRFGEGGAPDASLTTSGAAILFAHTADSQMSIGPGAGFTQIFRDDWSTIAEEKLVMSAGDFSVSAQPASGERWGIETVALRACQSP